MSDKYVITITPENAMGGYSQEDETIFGYTFGSDQIPTTRSGLRDVCFFSSVEEAKETLAELLFGNPDSQHPLKMLEGISGYTTVRFSDDLYTRALMERVHLGNSLGREARIALKIRKIGFIHSRLMTSGEILSLVVNYKYLGLHKEAIQQSIY